MFRLRSGRKRGVAAVRWLVEHTAAGRGYPSMKHGLAIASAAGLIALFGFFGWAFYATRDFGSWTGGSLVVALMIALGVIFTGGLTGALMWLAFYSSRKGYDDGVFKDGDL